MDPGCIKNGAETKGSILQPFQTLRRCVRHITQYERGGSLREGVRSPGPGSLMGNMGGSLKSNMKGEQYEKGRLVIMLRFPLATKTSR